MLNNIRKFRFYMKKSGFRQTARLIGAYVWGKFRSSWFRFLAKLFYKAKMRHFSEKIKDKTILVFTPSVEWNFLFQRAQQLSTCYAKKPSVAVVYLTTQIHDDNFVAISEIAPNLYLINSVLAEKLDEYTSAAKEVISCIFNISYYPLVKLYHSDKIEYEYVDDLTVTVSKADSLEEKFKIHQELLKKADLVVATASKLLDEVTSVCKTAIFAPNAVDYDFFSQKVQPARQLTQWRNSYSCIIVYYGALASWFDYELVKKTAELHPEWNWVLIGKKIDNDMKKSGIESLHNVQYIPAVPYKELPTYVAGADILTIPFLLNEITESTSPVKLFEYMAGGKPIITSDLVECRHYQSVHIYHSVQEFCDLVDVCLSKKHDPNYLSLLQKEALENTWDSRAEQILQALGVL